MTTDFRVGDLITSITEAGLILSTEPCDGKFEQKRTRACALRGIGIVLETNDITIDYDTWPDVYKGTGKLTIRSYHIRCADGEGWGSAVKLAPPNTIRSEGKMEYKLKTIAKNWADSKFVSDLLEGIGQGPKFTLERMPSMIASLATAEAGWLFPEGDFPLKFKDYIFEKCAELVKEKIIKHNKR